MNEELKEAICINRGICCDRCQEDVNIHGCWKCKKHFYEGEKILCKHHSQTDCEHYHKQCKPKQETKK